MQRKNVTSLQENSPDLTSGRVEIKMIRVSQRSERSREDELSPDTQDNKQTFRSLPALIPHVHSLMPSTPDWQLHVCLIANRMGVVQRYTHAFSVVFLLKYNLCEVLCRNPSELCKTLHQSRNPWSLQNKWSFPHQISMSRDQSRQKMRMRLCFSKCH